MMNKENKEKNVKKGGIKKFVSILEYIVIFVILFANIILIYKTVTNPNKTPDLFGKKAFIIVSGSMIPTIEIGDIVVIDDTTDVKVNDIIAFREGSIVIVHRIINEEVGTANEIQYETKGDNNDSPDVNKVVVENIEGRFSFKIPVLGKVLLLLYNNLFYVVIVLIVIVLFRFIKF